MYSPLIVHENRLRLEKVLGRELQDHSISEIDSFQGELDDWVKKWRSISKRKPDSFPPFGFLPAPFRDFITDERRLSTISYEYWVERHAKIVSDSGELVRFHLWPSQRKFLGALAEEEERQWRIWLEKSLDPTFRAKFRFIVVKSRQVGATRFGQSVGAHLTMLFPNTRSIAASDTPEKTLELWRLWDDIYSNMPWWMRPELEGRVKGSELFFGKLGSTLHCGAGNQKGSLGQGLTVDFFHITECSTWLPEVAAMLDKDLLFAFLSSQKSRSVGIIESTAEGGFETWFTKQYRVAKTGASQYRPLFIGWFLCPDKFKSDDESIRLRDETLAIGKRIERQNPGLKLTAAQLRWYQLHRDEFVAKGELSVWLQEAPSDPEEAFQFGTNSVFAAELRETIKAEAIAPVIELRYEPEIGRLSDTKWDGKVRPDSPLEPGGMDGILFMWEDRRPGFKYYIGMDASYGKEDKDATAVEVIRGPARGFPAEQVAEWRGFCSPGHIAKLVMQLGDRFHDQERQPAMVAPDTTHGSPGIVCLTQMIEANYPSLYVYQHPDKVRGERVAPKFGFDFAGDRRNVLVSRGMDGLKTHHLKIHSPGILDEMSTFVKKYNETSGYVKIEHAEGHHDDRLMALFIAYYIATEDSALMDNDRELRFRREEKGVELPSRRLELWEATDRDAWLDEWERRNGL